MRTKLELSLPCDATAPRRARRAVAEAIERWCSDEQLDDVVIVVSELVRNAVRHTRCPPVLRVSGEPCGGVEIEVHDSDICRPRSDADDGHLGRGLGVVQQLTDRWGIQRTPRGKCVWAEIRWNETTPDEQVPWPATPPTAAHIRSRREVDERSARRLPICTALNATRQQPVRSLVLQAGRTCSSSNMTAR